MDVLIFDIKGKFAHFRKFYTNSSSLSYSVPPRTVIEGIIASMLGMERDSYYETLNKENINIAVRKLNKTYKIVQSLNYIKATGVKNIIEPTEHTQIPFEIVTADKGAAYRIYVSSKNQELFYKINDTLKNNRIHYMPYLGAAPFNCSIDYIGTFNGEEKKEEDYVKVSSLVNTEYIKEKGLYVKDENLFLVREKMPADFLKDRIVREVGAYIYDENCNAVKVKLNVNYIKLSYSKGSESIEENILFM